MKTKNFEIRALYIILLGAIFLCLFSGCVNQQKQETTTTVEERITTTTEISTTEKVETTATSKTTTTVLSDCNTICSNEGYSKTLGEMNAVECDKNTPVNSSKKWKFNCCCYNE